MRFLADENIPAPVIASLRQSAHDVLSAKESLQGSPDTTVLELARQTSRILLTFDKDFGELAFHANLPAESGIILFRLSGASPLDDNARILATIQSRSDWPGHFSVITNDRIRIRPLPPPTPNR